MLRWEESVSEEVKLEVVFRTLSAMSRIWRWQFHGDLRTGYRLRISGYNYLALETTEAGYWDLLQRCEATLDPRAAQYG